MFKNTEKANIILLERDIDICPYCNSSIIKEGKRKPQREEWIQLVKCEICGNPWTRVYNDDQSLSYIVLDDITNKKGKSAGG